MTMEPIRLDEHHSNQIYESYLGTKKIPRLKQPNEITMLSNYIEEN